MCYEFYLKKEIITDFQFFILIGTNFYQQANLVYQSLIKNAVFFFY